MLTVMFVRIHLNGVFLFYQPVIQLSLHKKKLGGVYLCICMKVRQDKGNLNYGFSMMPDVSRHAEYMEHLPTLLHNYTTGNQGEEWENLSFRSKTIISFA